MFTLKDLTPEIEAKIPEYIERALNGVFDGGRYKSFDESKAEAAVYNTYEKCDYKKPVVLVAGNPYEAQIFINIIKNNEHLSSLVYLNYCLLNDIDISDDGKLYEKLDGNLYEKLREKLDGNLYEKLDGNLYENLYEKLREKLYGKLREKLDGKLREKLYGKLDGKLYGKLREKLDGKLREKLYEKLDGNLYEKLDGNLYGKLDGNLYGKLREKLDGNLYEKLDGNLYENLYEKLREKLYGKLYEKLDGKLREKLDGKLDGKLYGKLYYYNPYLYTLNIWSNGYFGWYNFIANEFKIQEPIVEELKIFSSLYEQSGIYNVIVSEMLAVVSKYPKKVYRDNNDELHNPSAPALEWESVCEQTNFENYYIHGRSLPKWIWDKAKSGEITRELFLREQNAEIKAGMYEVLGQTKIMDLLGAELQDKQTISHINGDREEVELYQTKEKFEEIDNEPFKWVKVTCPSTGSNYLLGVEPNHTDAKEALASLSPFEVDEYSFNFRT